LRFALKNILRRRTRTLLTIAGISIGIATIVSLGILAAGLQASLGKILTPADVDLAIAEAGAGDIMLSKVTTEHLRKIQSIEGVQTAFGQLVSITQTDSSPFFTVFGLRRQDLKIAGIEIVKGQEFADGSNEVIIGKIAANNLNKEPGDNIVLGTKTYKIVGIYESGNPIQDGGAVHPIDVLQTDKETDEFTMVLVDLSDSVKDVGEFGQKIKEIFDGELVALSSAAEYIEIDQGMEIIDFVVHAISFLAVVIGGIGAMNTIMMSVFERTREIGILRAVGWSRKRVFAMILNESIIIGICATVVGVLLGILVVAFIMTFPIARSFIQPVYPESIFAIAVIVGILASVIGGTYPAIRATKFAPTEALRYE
ncbi:ABC transporter permease, partial [Dehalococcoidia bacterium]|nr:ABC transporter permease [Dehalococcoidia bacterium]